MELKQIEPTQALTIASLADGNYRAALQLLSEKDDTIEKLFLDWMQLLIRKNKKDWASFNEQIVKLNRDNTKFFIKYGLHLLRQSVVNNSTNMNALPEREKAFCNYIAGKLSMDAMQEVMQLLNDMYFHVERNANPKILLMHNSFKISNLF